jgi:CP family cyanate transporter-like MFS transporter
LPRTAIRLGLVWLTAFNLRVVMFAVPPALPAIRASLGLSFSATGLITSLMVLTLGLASVPGALLATRYGARRLVAVCGFGLVIFTVTLVLPPPVFWVFAGSALLAVSIAVAQPPLSVLIRRWFPGAITRAANLYGNGLLIGNVVGAALSPVLVHLIGWREMFLVWAAVVLVGALLWVRFAPHDRAAAPTANLGAMIKDSRVWQVAALFTFQNVAYYTVATWLPFLLSDRGPGYVAVALLFLNFLPIVPLLALSVTRWQYALSTPYYAMAGVVTSAGALGMLLGRTDIAWLLAFMVGLGAAAAFIGSLALPPLLAGDEGEAAVFSSLVFAAGYVLAFAGPITAGALVDSTGQVTTAFWPAIVGGILMAVFGSLAPRLLVKSRTAARP